MSVNQEARRHAFAKLRESVTKVAHHPRPENVHRVRTSARRVETILGDLIPDLDRNQKKLLKALAGIRKKAGKIRDLDVHIANLRNLKVSQDQAGKARLLRRLLQEHEKRKAKFDKNFDKETVYELRKRLERVDNETVISEKTDPLALALQVFSTASQQQGALDADRLHQFRIAGKRARYLAEIAESTPEAERVVAQLNRMQDVIGDWHDWLELTEKAEDLLGGVRQSALVAALSNITRAKFRQAIDVLAETQARLLPRNGWKMQNAVTGRKSQATMHSGAQEAVA
jgi:CHAD domain-containing protein